MKFVFAGICSYHIARMDASRGVPIQTRRNKTAQQNCLSTLRNSVPDPSPRSRAHLLQARAELFDCPPTLDQAFSARVVQA